VEALAALFGVATACIIAAGRLDGTVTPTTASIVLLNAGFALPIFAMSVTSETDLAAFAAHRQRLRKLEPPRPTAPILEAMVQQGGGGGSSGGSGGATYPAVAAAATKDLAATATLAAPAASSRAASSQTSSNTRSHTSGLTASVAPVVGGGGASTGALSLALCDVELRYAPPPAPPVVHALTLSIAAGERFGILGRSGAGKSTVARCIARLLAPSRGEVTLGGVPLRAFSEADLRRKVACVPQEPTVFSGSLRMNLDPTSEHADASVLRACDEVGARSSLLTASGGLGLETQLSADGLAMSAGERQQLCLARALLVGAGLVVLDEATSSLGDASMRPVEAALVACARRSTVLQIAHQTSAVMGCGRVAVMVNGRVAECGVPSRLLEGGLEGGQGGAGLFASLVRADARARAWAAKAELLVEGP